MTSHAIQNDVDELVATLLQLDRVASNRVLHRFGAQNDGLIGLESVISGALESIGERWEAGSVSLAQVYLTAKMCQELLRPWTPPESLTPKGNFALVVLEDQHTLGAGLVRAVLACAGMAPVYWGSLDTAGAIARILAEKPQTLLVSTLMLRSALRVSKLTKAIRDAGLSTRVIVGGAPFRFDAALWQEVGADAVGRTSADALALLRAAHRGDP